MSKQEALNYYFANFFTVEWRYQSPTFHNQSHKINTLTR